MGVIQVKMLQGLLPYNHSKQAFNVDILALSIIFQPSRISLKKKRYKRLIWGTQLNNSTKAQCQCCYVLADSFSESGQMSQADAGRTHAFAQCLCCCQFTDQTNMTNFGFISVHCSCVDRIWRKYPHCWSCLIALVGVRDQISCTQ